MAYDRLRGTKGSVLLILLLGVVIVAAVAVVFLVPGLLENVTLVIATIVVVMIMIVAIVWIFMLLIAFPMYGLKGESYQTGVSYDLDDVESVREVSSEQTDRK